MDDERNLKVFPKLTNSKNTIVAAEKSFFDSNAVPNENVARNNKTTPENKNYDPQGMRPKSIICSEIISKTRLTTREADFQNSVVKSPVESDEAFFEKLKERIYGDRKRLERSKSAIVLPKRASTMKKRRSVFNSESLNLMKKFRHEILTRTDRLSNDHGIFSMSSKSNGDEENFHATNPPKQTSQISGNNDKEPDPIVTETTINKNISNTDHDSPCLLTPLQIRREFENLNRTSPSSPPSILSWDQVQNY